MSTITKIVGREVLDSRGNPTVEADVYLSSGVMGRAIAPSGASTGSREALELRDGDNKRYLGKGVSKAVANINTHIQDALLKQFSTDQTKVDAILCELDGTSNKAKLGANAALAVSLAIAKAAAKDQQQPFYQYLANSIGSQQLSMPVPMMNIINGGAHADNNLDIQEFMIIPVGAPNFQEALRYGAEVFHVLKKILHQKQLNTAVGDEGGFAPNLNSHAAAIEIILEAIQQAGYQVGKDIYLGLDVASSEFYQDSYYNFENKKLSNEQLVEYLANLTKQYPIISIEDGMAENDREGWQLLTQKLDEKIQLVGDDIFVTNTSIFKECIAEKLGNAILIKPNQIGTLSETLAAISMAKTANYAAVISHRSGETEDTTIADLAVATGAGQIKTGSLCRTDRIAKYNQLLRIESSVTHIKYAGRNVFKGLI